MDGDLLRAVAADAGLAVSEVSALPGEHGAVRVTSGGRQVVVVKVTDRPSPWLAHLGPVMEALAEHGPVPRLLHAGQVGATTYWVQEWLPGSPPRVLPAGAWPTLLRVHRAQRGLAAQLGLEGGDQGFDADNLRALSQVAPALVDRIMRRAEDVPPGAAPTGDVVHRDLHHGNLLVTRARLTGVLDWDGWSPGDCRSDLVTLLFSARTVTRDAALGDTLLRMLRADLEPELRWLYAARDVVRTLGWFARHHPGWNLPPWIADSTAVLDELS